MHPHVIIIGNGIAGVTAALTLRRRESWPITLISDESPYFFSRTALMYSFMGEIPESDLFPYPLSFWRENQLTLLHDRVTHMDLEKREITLASGKSLSFDHLVIATGSQPKQLPVENAHGPGICYLQSWQDLEKLESQIKGVRKAVIVGGGLVAVEMAEMLLSRGILVTQLVREGRYWANGLPPEEGSAIGSHILRKGVDLRFGTELGGVIRGETGELMEIQTLGGHRIACQMVGVGIGVEPNVSLAKRSGLACVKGILVKENFETNFPGVYAIGDCAEWIAPPTGRNPMEGTWYAAKAQGAALGEILSGASAFPPSKPWFNSGKFFELEFQAYGGQFAETPPSMATLVWMHPSNGKSIRLTWDRSSQEIRGFLVVGIRYRQSVCEKMVSGGWKLDDVVRHLPACNFDPEFSPRHEGEFLALFNRTFQKNLSFLAKKELNALIYS